MNQTEAQSLIAYLNRAGALQALEGQAAVWADAMPNVRFDDAQAVARSLVTKRTGQDRWVVPGDILYGVNALRRDRIDGNTYLITTRRAPSAIDPDDYEAESQWRRLIRGAVADGHEIDAAADIACQTMGISADPPQVEAPRPVGTLIQQVAEALPRIPRKAS